MHVSGQGHGSPTPLACTECRRQHLKCDARKPTCTRCTQCDLACFYLPSRRGGRRTRAAAQALRSSQPAELRQSENTRSQDQVCIVPNPQMTAAIDDIDSESEFLIRNAPSFAALQSIVREPDTCRY